MNSPTRERALQLLNKVPEVTLYFWIIKILATTVGETAADFFATNLNFGLTGTSAVMGVLLLVFVLLQIRAIAYVPWLYWVTVVLISVAGTLVTDNLVGNLGVALQTTTILFALALLATFVVWFASERTLSIRSICTRKRELYYWAAILFTFALGTAAGDLVAEGLNLGYAYSTLAFAALIGAVTLAYYGFKANAVLAFWIAYILTRPLGASLGDLLSQSAGNGGLGLGTMLTSGIFLATIASLVTYLTATRKDASGTTATLNGGT